MLYGYLMTASAMTTYHRHIDDRNQTIPIANGDDVQVTGTSSSTASLPSATTSPMAVVGQSLANQNPDPYLTVETYFNFKTVSVFNSYNILSGNGCITNEQWLINYKFETLENISIKSHVY